jgi:hypothetical protein
MEISFVFINPFPKIAFEQKLKFIIFCVVSTERHGKYKKYISFPWSSVVSAHNRKKLVQALQSSGNLLAVESYPYPKIQYSPSDTTFPFTMYCQRFPMKITLL